MKLTKSTKKLFSTKENKKGIYKAEAKRKAGDKK